MKIALVHDYLKDFGGAERVLEAFCEIWPEAPIYTAFVDRNSSAYKRFKGKKIITSWAQNIPFFASFLHSPLRFLAPLIWGSFSAKGGSSSGRDFSKYDVVLASSSWFITRGFKRAKWSKGTKGFVEICYCHTPPRYLYGYPTSVEWQKYWPARIYAAVVNHFMRVYDFEASQKTDYFIANSKEVAARIKKFYRRDSKVIYPPVDVKRFSPVVNRHPGAATNTIGSRDSISAGRLARLKSSQWRSSDISGPAELAADIASLQNDKNSNYFLVVSRLVAAKKVDIVVEVCAKLGLPLKVVGAGKELEHLKKLAKAHPRGVQGSNMDHPGGETSVEFLGEVEDSELVELYQNCRAVIFPAEQEDFGLVPVEAAACGKPVIANAQGGVLESVIDPSTHSVNSGSSTRSARSGQVLFASKGKCTGVYFDPPTTGSLTLALNNFMDLEKKDYFDSQFIRRHAQKFSKERFTKEIEAFVESKVGSAKR